MSSTARLPHSPASRVVGISLVGLVHVVAFTALINGLTYQPAIKPMVTELVAVKLAPPPPPAPTEHRHVARLEAPQAIPTPMPEAPLIAPDIVQMRPLDADVTDNALTASDLPSLPVGALQEAHAVCERMSKPSMPVNAWSGDAVFRAVASTHGGRVVQVDIQALSGQMDARTQHAFAASIERALRNGYECARDVRFMQEFRFHVE